MAFFCYDIETLSVESTAVILSAAIVSFNFDQTDDLDAEFKDLVGRTMYVKFDAKEQIQNYKRVATKDTLDWWAKQGEYVRNLCFLPTKQDKSALEGINLIKNYIKEHTIKGEDNIIWVRGSLDQLATDSLCSAVGVESIERYSNFRDVRTAVDILAETSKGGYCKLSKPFNQDLVCKHIPSHDIALDILMLKYPK